MDRINERISQNRKKVVNSLKVLEDKGPLGKREEQSAWELAPDGDLIYVDSIKTGKFSKEVMGMKKFNW